METNYVLLQETTQWNHEGHINHIYAFETKPGVRKADAVGYIRRGSDNFYKFISPLTMDLRNRTFVVVGKTKWSME